MAHFVDEYWVSEGGGITRRDRQGCQYRAYVPDPLCGRGFSFAGDVAADVADAEAAVARLNTQAIVLANTEALARLLLRAEAVASSKIEGLEVGPRRLLHAEAQRDSSSPGRADVTAYEVLGNIDAMAAALAAADGREVTVSTILEIHRQLMVGTRLAEHAGRVRDVQNWIGGSSYNPCSAAFVPPPSAKVPGLLTDLAAFCNDDSLPAVAQAAIVHAQFETIHPFTDGNGRVGRALIHTVLTRRGLTPSAILPVSLVLATLKDTYVAGLTDYRYEAPPTAAEAHAGVAAWLAMFLAATTTAAAQARLFADQIGSLKAQWEQQVSDHRARQGVRGTPRADSASSRLLAILPEVPILTTRTVQRLLRVSFPPARAGLEELAEAGVLSRRSVEQGTTGYVATELFQILGHAERQLASTRWDTREAPPSRPAPARTDLPPHRTS